MNKFAILGDMGTGDDNQLRVAKSLKKLIDLENLQFVTGLGDNIYDCGATTVDDIQFVNKFEKPYSKIDNKIKFYMTLGNHDYGEHYCKCQVEDRELLQIKYGQLSQKNGKKWYMPSRYYTFRRGDIEFFALDANVDKQTRKEIDEQIRYMKPKIEKSTAKWKIAYGHQPWVSIGDHGNAPPKLHKFFNSLFGSGLIDIYMCGDDHNKQLIEKTLLKINKKMILIVCGTGGRETDKPYNLENINDDNDDLQYFSSTYGIATIIENIDSLEIKFYDNNCKIEFKYLLKE
jgi:tartrate-resistant acid phosphatase type 5